MKFLEELEVVDGRRDLSALVRHIPYGRFLGIEIEQIGDEVITVLRKREEVVGNIILGALHGGVVAAMLEMTAMFQLLHETGATRLPRTVDVSFDYLRSAQGPVTYGRAVVTRRGRRVANVRSELWQESRSTPIALSHGHFVLAQT